MRLFIGIALAVLAALGTQEPLLAQDKGCAELDLPGYRHLEALKKHPDLGIDYGRVTNFKLASRKTTYRMDELISIDMAMMNTSNAKVFFFNKLGGASLTLTVEDEKGIKKDMNYYWTTTEVVTEEQYSKLYPNTFVSGSFQLLAGCEGSAKAYLKEREKLFADIAQDKTDIYRGLFERDLFANWGTACLDIKGPGTYLITAEMSNDGVIASSCEPEVKTAIGKIRSAPLKITIVE